MSYREKELAPYLARSQVGVSEPASTGRYELVRVNVPVYLAGGWVITLSPVQRVRGVSADQRQAYAVCTYGYGSALSVIEVDWGQGSQFSVFGSDVAVAVENPSVLGGPPWQAPILFRASVMPGSISPATPLTRSVYYGTIAAGASVDARIPALAKTVWFEADVAPGPANAWVAEWLRGDPAGPTALQTLSMIPGFQQQVPYKVAPEANQLRVTAGAVQLDSFVAIYELAL